MPDDQYVSSVKGDSIDDTLEHHEERITKNEEFRLMAKGAIIVISAILGSGFGFAIFNML